MLPGIENVFLVCIERNYFYRQDCVHTRKYQGGFEVECHVLLAGIFQVEAAGSMCLAVSDSVKTD